MQLLLLSGTQCMKQTCSRALTTISVLKLVSKYDSESKKSILSSSIAATLVKCPTILHTQPQVPPPCAMWIYTCTCMPREWCIYIHKHTTTYSKEASCIKTACNILLTDVVQGMLLNVKYRVEGLSYQSKRILSRADGHSCCHTFSIPGMCY